VVPQWQRPGPVGQLGFSLNGTFSDVIADPANNLVPLPDSVSFEDAALLSCGGMTAVHAVRLSAAAGSPGQRA
jgi:D-arabinose 1-dehydrogenase-like Zn-dependent alcohol dehydrogenase